MRLNRALILLLICCVIAREDFPFVLTSVSAASSENAQIHSDEEASALRDDDAVTLDDDSELFDEDVPAPDELPADDAKIPSALEDDLDPETEEVLGSRNHKAHFRFVAQCHLHEGNAPSFASFNSFCTLKRLRT